MTRVILLLMAVGMMVGAVVADLVFGDLARAQYLLLWGVFDVAIALTIQERGGHES